MAKTIKAVFGVGECTKVCPQWQYDYNTVLQFVGLDLPANYEVDLSNSKTGQSTTVLGDEHGCVIPAQYFIPGSSIFAWVFVAGSDYGYTRAQVEIPISPRAQHTGDPPTPAQQDALDAAIALLNDAADALEEAESQIVEHGITPEEREKLAGIEAGAEVNAIDEIRYYDPLHGRWEAYPITNNGVNLPDPVIPERVAVFDFTVDAEDMAVTTTVNPPSIVPIGDAFVSFARVQYDSRVLLLPLTEWNEQPVLALFFCGKISDTETMSLSYDALEDSWIATVDTFGQQYVDEIATDLQEQIGNLSDLQTTVKSDLVSAINEVAESGGGGGGSSDYDDLSNKPSIEGVTLSGNKTAAQLGLAKASDIPTVPVQSVNGKTGAVVLNASDVGAGTYSKPSGGIPKTDLASAVQTSLGKADTALQSYTETDPTVPSWAKQSSKPSYTASEVGAVAVDQGVAHAGEFLVVGSDGNVTTVTMTAWTGGSY